MHLAHYRSHGCGLYLRPTTNVRRKCCKMNTYAKCAANPRRMRTSKTIEFKDSYNQHFQESGGWGGLIVTQRPPTARGLERKSPARVSSSRSPLPTLNKRVTLEFPAASALFARSFACVQVSTCLFSRAHALFCRNTREGVHPRLKIFKRFFKFEREAPMQPPARRAAVNLVKGRSRGNQVELQQSSGKGKLAP
jgi:hypothetical protein